MKTPRRTAKRRQNPTINPRGLIDRRNLEGGGPGAGVVNPG
jgi:hypothetical protein